MKHLETINKALHQLEFIKDFPDQNKVVEEIQKTLGKEFTLSLHSIAYFTQALLIPLSGYYFLRGEYKAGLKYSERSSPNHKARVIKKALLKAKEYYESQTISTTNS